MRLYLTKGEAIRIRQALQATMATSVNPDMDERIINRIDKCMDRQKPFDKHPPDEAERLPAETPN